MRNKFIFSLLGALCGLAVALPLAAQSRLAVTGSVTEEATGEPVPGATVLVKGTRTGVTADSQGIYRIEVSPDARLVFSCFGYKDREEAVDGRSVINAALANDTFVLDEVIAVGYGTVKKTDLTGSVASVRATDVVKSPGASIDKMLQGRVAGLTVIDASNDSPQASVTMRIRGISSINGSNAPLVVIDGVPYGDAGNLTAVNPNVIESIEVLKDASATAIYGSRGANGVIMITTKTGREDHTDVWFSGKVGVGVFSRPLKVWKQNDLVRMAETTNMQYENGGAEGPYMGKVFSDGIYYPSVEEIRDGIWPYYTDWTKEVFRTAVTQDYNVGVEGSSRKSRYYAALGYYAGQGMQHNDDYRKFSGDLSYTNEITRSLSFTSKAGFVAGDRTYNCGTSYGINPLWPVRNGDGSYYRPKSNDYSNPVMINNEVTNFAKDLYGTISARLDWTIVDGLVLSVSGNGKMYQARGAYFNPPEFTFAGDMYKGEGGVSESTWRQLQTDAFLTWTRSFGQHNISVMAGGSWEDRVDESSSLTGRGFTNSSLRYEAVASAEKLFGATGRSEWAIASAFTRLTYDWAGKYFATFTARADGSSKFAQGHKWGFFPSGALSWRLDREPWIKEAGFFDLLKLRASYGVSGNQGIAPYQTFERYGYDYYWDYASNKEYRAHGVGYQSGREGVGDRYVTYAGMANHDLTWEKTSMADIGLDVAFLGNRVEITADYYYKYTSGLLRQQYLAPSSGFDTVWVNDGEMLNQGFEFSVTGRIVENREWSLSATGILSMNRNKVLRLGTNENSGFTTDASGLSYTPHGGSVYDSPTLNVLAIGQPVNVFYGYRVDGIIQSEQGDGTSRYTEEGELNYIGLKADGTFDADQRTLIGDPNPKLTGSLSLSMTHRIGLDFSLLLYGVWGNDIFSYRKLNDMLIDGNFWTPEQPSRTYPKLRYNRSYQASSWSVEDGSFLRVSNVTLGYTIPPGTVRWLKNFRVYVSASNPYTFFRSSEYDPEVGENGNASPAYPRVCTITTGLEIKF